VSDGPEAAQERIRTLLQLRRGGEALQMARDCLTQWPDDAEVHRLAALSAHQVEAHDDAVRHAVAALRLDPDDPAVVRTSALVHLGADRWKEAFDLIDRAVAMDPLDAHGHLLRSNLHLTAALHLRGTEDWYLPTARSAAHEAIRLEPDGAEGYVLLAAIAIARKDLVAARAHALTALARDPQSTDAHQLLGRVADREGDREAAERHYLDAGQLDPRDDRPRLLLGGVGRPGVRGFFERMRAPWR
jgi:Flp pilus assembly protein TadD